MRSSSRLGVAVCAGFTLLSSLTAPLPLNAQEVRSNTKGFLLAPRLTGSSLEVEDGSEESGGGAGLMLGWGVSRRVALFIGADITEIDIRNPDFDGSFFLVQADLGVRVSFRSPEHKFVPYAVGALTGMAAAADVQLTPFTKTEVELTGGGLTLGGGFNYFFIPTLALDVQLLGTAGSFTDLRIGSVTSDIDDIDATAGRFTLGLTWYPIRGR